VREIENHAREAKANYDFKSSLFWQQWTSFGATAEEQISLTDITSKKSLDHLQIRIYALPIPRERASISLVKLRLRDEFHLHAIAMETDDGVIVNPGADTELVMGATLWVAFEIDQDVPGLVHNWLDIAPDNAPVQLKMRCLPLEAFLVGRIARWVDLEIESTEMRSRYGINLLGFYRGCDIGAAFFFPSPRRQLRADCFLLVLPSDVQKLEEIQREEDAASRAANSTTFAPSDSRVDGAPRRAPLKSPPQGSVHLVGFVNASEHFTRISAYSEVSSQGLNRLTSSSSCPE